MPYPEYLPYQRRKRSWFRVLLVLAISGTIAGLLLYQIPYVNRRVNWRFDIAITFIRSVIHPAGELPTPAVKVTAEGQKQIPAQVIPFATSQPTITLTPTVTPIYTPTPTLVPHLYRNVFS